MRFYTYIDFDVFNRRIILAYIVKKIIMNLKICFQITGRKQYKLKTLGSMSLQASFDKLNKLKGKFSR